MLCGFSHQSESQMLHLSSSEEVDVVSVDPSGLVEVVTRAEAKQKIDWPAEKQDIRPKSTAVSSECSSQCPPGNIASLGGSHPPRLLELSEQLVSTGHLLQGAELTAIASIQRGHTHIGAP